MRDLNFLKTEKWIHDMTELCIKESYVTSKLIRREEEWERPNKEKIFLTSHGLTTSVGRQLIGDMFKKDPYLEKRRIFLFHEPYYSIEPILTETCIQMGFREENIIFSGQQKNNDELLHMDYFYVTEGNTFEILNILRERDLTDIIYTGFWNGGTYIGASAGAMIAGVDIEEASMFDRNFVRMDDCRALGLFNGIVIPHRSEKEAEAYLASHPELEAKYEHIVSVGEEELCMIY